jgi:DNA-directed RNA polymerase specialized sigma24 family protein
MASDHATAPDAELIYRSRDDADAFRALYDRYSGRICAFLLRRTGDTDAAVELTAETFAQAWMSRHRFRDLVGGTAGPWLFTIARRTLIRSVAKQRLERTALERLQADLETRGAGHITPTDAWLADLDADIAAALGDLPPE